MKIRNWSLYGAVALATTMTFSSCEQTEVDNPAEVSNEVLAILTNAGFDVENQAPITFENGYLVEGDIYIPSEDLASLKEGNQLPNDEHYHTTNLVAVNGSRNITLYVPEGGNRGYSPVYVAAADEAIARFNAENLTITMSRVTSSSQADIVFTRLRKGDERRGVLGSAGFPTSAGDPYGEIKMSGILESSYGLSVNGIATIMAHEIGHCIGFRHTDFYDRSISCGGSPSNEGASTVGAEYIPGTPAIGEVSLAKKSWMLACADGGDRPFNNNDKVALDYLY
ncbi:M57 family metalloprotease [Algivirga pacifica]|uniref:Dual-action HEIGH metallo-peptidase n=1 Tax=Algivirga pacifica TaxID=1162670 RepID=A0ABP9DG01_9BACT